MKRFYRIMRLGPGLDGLVVEAEHRGYRDNDRVIGLFEISKIFNLNQVIGDRAVSFSLPERALHIESRFLEATDDPENREYAHDNVLGKYVTGGYFDSNDFHVAWARHENGMQVTVQEKIIKSVTKSERVRRTRYSQNFFRELDTVHQTIEDLWESDVEDLIFALQELKLKEAENDGEAR